MFYVIPRVRELLSLQRASSIRFSPGIAATHSGDTCFQNIIITILIIIFPWERDSVLEIFVLLMGYCLDRVIYINFEALLPLYIMHAFKSNDELIKKNNVWRPAVE